jgi:hypothetical protein
MREFSPFQRTPSPGLVVLSRGCSASPAFEQRFLPRRRQTSRLDYYVLASIVPADLAANAIWQNGKEIP